MQHFSVTSPTLWATFDGNSVTFAVNSLKEVGISENKRKETGGMRREHETILQAGHWFKIKVMQPEAKQNTWKEEKHGDNKN